MSRNQTSCYFWQSCQRHSYVDLSKLSGKSKRVNITMPERLLALVDQYASRHGETRSGLLAQAAMEFIAARSRVGEMA
ncbi:MAG TPA: hypothetical protein G4N98_04860 [Thermoflexia bacterium]|nr:hypothetical protein [Thermoflexia bacterium]